MKSVAINNKSIPLEEIFRKEKNKLTSFIRKAVKTKEDAEDISQDVFLQLIKASYELQTIESVTSWIYRVARNKIIDLYRKKSTVNFSDLGKEESLVFENLLPDLNELPDKQYWQEQVKQTIDEALEELPAEQREVFVMHEFEQKSFKEINEMTDVSINTLISRKRYAILHLRNRLSALYEEMN